MRGHEGSRARARAHRVRFVVRSDRARRSRQWSARRAGRAARRADGADPEQLLIVRATPEFFQVVRSEPVVGRLFDTEEHGPVIVLSHAFWQRKFGGERSAVGQTLRLDSVPYTIIGVLPASYQFPVRSVHGWILLNLR